MLTTQANNMYKYIFLIFLFIYFFEDTKGKISTQHHTIVKQICFPNGHVLFLSFVFSIQELNAQCSMGLFGNFTDPRVKDCAIFVKPL